MVTIHNKGKRLIQCAAGNIEPDSYFKMELEEAQKLKILFPTEITIIEEIQKEAEEKAEEAIAEKEAKEAEEKKGKAKKGKAKKESK